MKKKIISLFLCISMLCGVLSGCGGAGSQDTFLSEVLKTDEFDLMEFTNTDFVNYCDARDLYYDGGYESDFIEVTDSFLGYDAEQYFGFKTIVSGGEFEDSIVKLDNIIVLIEFESQEEKNTALEEMKNHLTSKIGATYNQNDNTYNLFWGSVEDSINVNIVFHFDVGENDIRLKGEVVETLKNDVENYDALLSYWYYGIDYNLFHGIFVKMADSDVPYYLDYGSQEITLYHYEKGTGNVVEKEKITLSEQIKSIYLTSDYKLCVNDSVYVYVDDSFILDIFASDIGDDYYNLKQMGSPNYNQCNYLTLSDVYRDMIVLDDEIPENAITKNYFSEYISYLEENYADEDVEGYHYNLVDFDADGTYELVYSFSGEYYILSYYNGKVIENLAPYYGSIMYKPSENILVQQESPIRGSGATVYFHLENGEIVVDNKASYLVDEELNETNYFLNDNSISEEEYDNYCIGYLEKEEWSGFQDVYSLAEIISKMKHKVQNQ